MKLYISFDNNPEYIRPLAIRLASDDHTIDEFAGIQDYSDTEQLKTLFKSWLKCVEEVNRQEQTVPTEPLIVKIPPLDMNFCVQCNKLEGTCDHSLYGVKIMSRQQIRPKKGNSK